MLGILATLMLGCGTEEVAPPPEPEVAPAPEPMPEPEAPAAGEAMTVDALNADQANQAGKSVSVKGFYSNMTKQDAPAQINVMVFQDAELAAGKIMCVFDVANEGQITPLVAKAEITVTGTVSAEKFFDSAKLEGCSLAGDAPVEEPAGGGKAKTGEGKTGKKAKGGKSH